MAEKRIRSEVAFWVANATFYHNGNVLVLAGHTVAAGHPLLKGKEALFRAFEPTWPLPGAAPEPAPEPEPISEPDPPAEPEPVPELAPVP
jgi:hypothetical protein